ncbi:hypothetical protein ABT373_37860 [Streptomyces sp. NPDC000070]|uniref:hypothetical protein n=1 Tax=Streptomyces sp. NPDC000070 TaxID=3154240 RepID=UPI0033202984
MSDSDEADPGRRLADRIERLRDPLAALVEAVSPPERGPRPSAGDPGPWEGPSDDERTGGKEDEEPGAAEERGPDAP